ncbi:MAG: hypothetical protein OXC18_13195 [Desulfurellaceae bacterium]|nr:hypothetical protein [Desulfurellaceae bacterium]
MKLPNAHRAQIERGKITDYLLSLVNPRSRAKADFFLSFGFSRDRQEEFVKALKAHAASYEVARVVETAYGPRYHVDGALETPDGRNPVIRTVWQTDLGSTYPRFITAYPRRR